MPIIRKYKSDSRQLMASTEDRIASPLVIALEEIGGLAVVVASLRKDFQGGKLKNERSFKYHLLALKRSTGNIDRALAAVIEKL